MSCMLADKNSQAFRLQTKVKNVGKSRDPLRITVRFNAGSQNWQVPYMAGGQE